MNRSPLILAFASFALAACPAPGPTPPSMAQDATLSAPAPSRVATSDACLPLVGERCDATPDARLSGRWTFRLPTGDVVATLTFDAARGTFRDEGASRVDEGTFHTAGGWLVRSAGGATAASPYVLAGDRLLLNAILPVGAHTGLVGRWSGDAALRLAAGAPDLVSTTIELATDGSGRLETVRDGVAVSQATTWRKDEHGRVLVEGLGALFVVDDAALGTELYTR